LSASQTPFDVLVLAAGLGTRMKSGKAKVLHLLDGRPLIAHVCRVADALDPRHIYVIVGHQGDQVGAAAAAAVGPDHIKCVVQEQQLGTGDAVMAARPELGEAHSTLLVLSGDVPLLRQETLRALVTAHRTVRAACTVLSVKMENPTGYGRVVRDEAGQLLRIVEQKDADEEQKKIREINSGIYCFETDLLFPALARVKPVNQQGEFYLTDVPEILRQDGARIHLQLHHDAREVAGINTRAELAEFENLLRRRTIRRLMTEDGVTFIDPAHAYISSEAIIGHDTVIHPDVQIEGASVIGDNCEIRAGSRITNSRLGANVLIKDHCVIIDSDLAAGCTAGPFAHLRMNAVLEEGAIIGNFVEVKKSRVGRGTKSMHLTYLGDATIGEGTNIGAGTVTCNYDGRHKHQTIIGDNVKIGSDTMLVAPVKVGNGAVTGAGSVVTKDVPPDTLVAGVPASPRKRVNQEEPGGGERESGGS